MAVALFWNEFFDWWSQVTSENIQLPDSTILYGPTNPLKHHQPLSLALLVAKYFIYKCNLNEQSLLFSLFKIQLRENIMTERYIEDITRWREDMNFIFEWQNNILRTSAASE